MKITGIFILLWEFLLLATGLSCTFKIEGSHNFTAKNYTSVPQNINKNVTVLDLSYNQITLNSRDINNLQLYVLMTELNLNNNKIVFLQNNSFGSLFNLEILSISSNYINTIGRNAFVGLDKLKELCLCQNKISQLNPYTLIPLKSLMTLNLQDNMMSYFEVPRQFQLKKINLYGNPWNCSCSLHNLQNWLNTSKVMLESESLGKSWPLLVGVVVVVLVTSLLIFIAIRCPTWYNFLFSYNHHRLEEQEDSYEDFTIYSRSLPQTEDTNPEENIVRLDQLNSFVVDEDGFIEDKYIDAQEMCEEN
ncbi:leucine-rich repeat-containing protein 19 isoform X2 [Macrotis lagotis]|uniref:leucine-rich repeat-containing protein 19 isoform X2 n=1 Tax=Macrotis lagotis TaxID=92651 RepID=UPI003D683784